MTRFGSPTARNRKWHCQPDRVPWPRKIPNCTIDQIESCQPIRMHVQKSRWSDKSRLHRVRTPAYRGRCRPCKQVREQPRPSWRCYRDELTPTTLKHSHTNHLTPKSGGDRSCRRSSKSQEQKQRRRTSANESGSLAGSWETNDGMVS